MDPSRLFPFSPPTLLANQKRQHRTHRAFCQLPREGHHAALRLSDGIFFKVEKLLSQGRRRFNSAGGGGLARPVRCAGITEGLPVLRYPLANTDVR